MSTLPTFYQHWLYSFREINKVSSYFASYLASYSFDQKIRYKFERTSRGHIKHIVKTNSTRNSLMLLQEIPHYNFTFEEIEHSTWQKCYLSGCFSYVTKSRIFKNLNLRRKVDRNFRGNLLKNHFRHLKFYSNLASWMAGRHCHLSLICKSNFLL